MCCFTLLLNEKRRFLLSYSTVIFVSALFQASKFYVSLSKIFGFLISLSPTMAATTFIRDPLVHKNLRHIAYISGVLSSVIGILGFTVAFSKNKTFVTVAVVTTSICLITLVSLAAHAFTYLGYQIALVPKSRVLALMNRTWIGVEGENFQRAVSTVICEVILIKCQFSTGKMLWTVWTGIIFNTTTTIMLWLCNP